MIRRESYVIRSKRFVRCDVDKSAEIGSRQILEECRKYMYKRLNLFESILASKTNHRQYRAAITYKKRRELAELEDNNDILIQILGSEGLFPEHLEIDCRDKNGNPINVK